MFSENRSEQILSYGPSTILHSFSYDTVYSNTRDIPLRRKLVQTRVYMSASRHVAALREGLPLSAPVAFPQSRAVLSIIDSIIGHSAAGVLHGDGSSIDIHTTRFHRDGRAVDRPQNRQQRPAFNGHGSGFKGLRMSCLSALKGNTPSTGKRGLKKYNSLTTERNTGCAA